jgi:transcriptional regulator with XRE-family HTH domain
MQAIQKRFGGRIRKLRLKKGWSQEAFADVCGIHRSHMGEIERGETNLTLSTMLVIAHKLEITLSALFRGDCLTRLLLLVAFPAVATWSLPGDACFQKRSSYSETVFVGRD